MMIQGLLFSNNVSSYCFGGAKLFAPKQFLALFEFYYCSSEYVIPSVVVVLITSVLVIDNNPLPNFTLR